MLTEELAASAYEQATDGCRRFGSVDAEQCTAGTASQGRLGSSFSRHFDMKNAPV